MGPCAGANELRQLYEVALSRDTPLQIAQAKRDAVIEARPQALAALLPQISASASASRERIGYSNAQLSGSQATSCLQSADSGSERCYGTVRGVGLNLSQTLWNFQAFSQLKEANFQAAAAEATLQGSQQSLLLRVSVAYFAILSAVDQFNTNTHEREAFAAMLNQAGVRETTGVGPHADVAQAQAFYDATDQSVIDAQNALDDALLFMDQLVGMPTAQVAPLRADIPLTSPEPASADDWVASARLDNLDVRGAQLKAEAASREISVQRGRGLPSVALVGSSSKLWQDDVFGGNQRLDTIGVAFAWPLFQGGSVASAVRQSRALYRQSLAEVELAMRDTERRTRAAFRNIVSGVQRINAGSRAVESGRLAVEASRRNVEFGTGTEFDLLNAQVNYYAAIRAYSQARYDYLTNVLTLKQQAGRLTERDLYAIDDLLVERGP